MKLKCSILLLLSCILAAPAWAAENLAGWNYTMPIQCEGTNKYKTISLPEEVYQHALPNLADLRIVDSQGNCLPFYIKTGEKILAENKSTYTAKVVQTFVKDENFYIDFKIDPLKDDEDISGNSLHFNLPSGNFLKHLQLYGGYDGNKWEYIGKDYVFKEADNTKAEISLIKKRKYTYYRVIVLKNTEATNLTDMLLIDSYIDSQWNRYSKTAAIDFTMETTGKDSKLTLNNRQNLRIKQITLEADGNFQRKYILSDGNKKSHVLKQGEIYNLALENIKVSGNKITLDTPITSPIITIKINNRDDQPLVINAILIEYYTDKIVFPDTGKGPYHLYFGNGNAARPNYEIDLQKDYIEKEKQDICTLATRTDCAGTGSEIDGKFILDDKYIFNGIIVAVSILLSGLIAIKLSKK